MGVMTKMREQTGSVIFLLVFAFGGLWMLQDSGVFEAVGAAPQVIGEVDGQAIDNELYQSAINQRQQLYEQQGVEVTPQVQAQIENEVFDALIDNQLREREMERLGIQVSDAEVRELIFGDNPDPIIRQLFPDGQGGVDRARLQEVADEAAQNPELRAQIIAIENQIRQTRRQAKLDALVAASVRVSGAEVEREFARQQRRASAEFVALRYADIPDGEVEVTESELKDAYRARRDDFERPETYSIEYVAFPKVPSAEDSSRALGELGELREGFATADDPGAFASEQLFGALADPAYVPAGDLHPDLAEAIYSDLEPGRVIGPVVAGEEVVLARITGVRAAEAPIVRARHILLPEGQEARARELKAQIESGATTFEAAARANSTDDSNKELGGDLGWFGRGRMVRDFENVAFATPVGRISAPVPTQFGVHLIKVEARSSQEAELVQIARPLEGSFEEVRERAEEFRFFTEEEGRPFADAALEQDLVTQSVQVQEDQPFVPGLQAGRDLMRFLSRAGEGDLSDPIDAGTQYVVVRMAEKTPAGVRPFEEVRSQVEADVLIAKKRALLAERLRTAAQGANGDLGAIASGAGTTPQSAPSLSMSNPVVEGFGREPALVGAAFGMRPGQTSGVVEGDNAVFIVRTRALRGGTPGELTAETRQQIREQLLQRKRQQVSQAWLDALRADADIVDNRNRLG